MPSIRGRILYQVARLVVRRMNSGTPSVAEARIAEEKSAAMFAKVPRGVALEVGTYGALPVAWLRPIKVQGPGCILYLHGGAYVTGSIMTHKGLVARLARDAGTPALLLEYRLAPEHPFPAALDDAVATYRQLVADGKGPVAIAGDSAGGGLAVATAMKLRDLDIAQPCALALIAPWTDLALTNETWRSKAAVDPYFPNTDGISLDAARYAAATSLDHPLVSPHYGDMNGLPPMLIHVGDYETLLDDARMLAKKAGRAGGDVRIEVWPGMWHVWQIAGGWMPEADRSIFELAQFLRRRLDAVQH